MFQSYLLRGALVALAISDKESHHVKAAATSAEDIANYPEYAEAMLHGIADFDWKSYPVTTSTGYEILLFRITPKVVPADNKGPLLLTHGMFSDPTDFLAQTDTTKAALPLQLAAMGYDVWVGCTRGRSITQGHTTLDKTDLI